MPSTNSRPPGLATMKNTRSSAFALTLAALLALTAPVLANRARSVNLGTTSRGTWVVVALDDEAEFGLSADGDTLSVRIEGAAPSSTLQRDGRGAVEGVRVVADGDDALLLITLAPGSYSYRAYAKRDPFQVCVDITPREGSSTSPADFGAGARIERIVIDPGHGGPKWTGTALPDESIAEKTAVMEQARILQRLLEDNLGVEVVLTRNDDYEVGLKGRCLMANDVDADLFISLHLNGGPRSAHGTETFYLVSGQATETRAAAMKENADFQSDPYLDQINSSVLDFILSDVYQTQVLEESALLARCVQRELLDELGLTDRGVKQDNFAVLRGTHMPAILVESYFMSSPDEGYRYTNAEGYRRVAEAVYRGVAAYIADYEARMK